MKSKTPAIPVYGLKAISPRKEQTVKHKLLLVVAVFGLAVSSAVAADYPMVGGQAMYPTKNIIENAVNSADHTPLVAAVKAAGLLDTLQGAGPFTRRQEALTGQIGIAKFTPVESNRTRRGMHSRRDGWWIFTVTKGRQQSYTTMTGDLSRQLIRATS